MHNVKSGPLECAGPNKSLFGLSTEVLYNFKILNLCSIDLAVLYLACLNNDPNI